MAGSWSPKGVPSSHPLQRTAESPERNGIRAKCAIHFISCFAIRNQFYAADYSLVRGTREHINDRVWSAVSGEPISCHSQFAIWSFLYALFDTDLFTCEFACCPSGAHQRRFIILWWKKHVGSYFRLAWKLIEFHSRRIVWAEMVRACIVCVQRAWHLEWNGACVLILLGI